jgi:hypothetical protein
MDENALEKFLKSPVIERAELALTEAVVFAPPGALLFEAVTGPDCSYTIRATMQPWRIVKIENPEK